MNCILYGGLELIAEYREDWYWISARLQSIGRTGSGSEMHGILYEGLVMGL